MGRDRPQPGRGGKKASANKKSKLVITFDVEKRKEYLTGFSKRKEERRRFGLDMEAFKQKKRLLEARKQRREEQKELMATLNIKDDDAKEEEEEDDDEEEEDHEVFSDDSDNEDDDSATKVMTFDDAHTQSKFGDVVTVTTSVGGFKSESEDGMSDMDDEDDELAAAALAAVKAKRGEKNNKDAHLTLFQRIQQQRKGMALPSKRSKLKQVRDSRKAMMGTGKKAGKKGAIGQRNGLARKVEGKGDKSDGKKASGGGGDKAKGAGKAKAGGKAKGGGKAGGKKR